MLKAKNKVSKMINVALIIFQQTVKKKKSNKLKMKDVKKKKKEKKENHIYNRDIINSFISKKKKPNTFGCV